MKYENVDQLPFRYREQATAQMAGRRPSAAQPALTEPEPKQLPKPAAPAKKPGGRNSPRNQRGVMNKTEAEYADLLTARGLSWLFEPFALDLGDGSAYTPDFIVYETGRVELHEVKGHWEVAARVRFKVAVDRHDWLDLILSVRKRSKADGGGFEVLDRFEPVTTTSPVVYRTASGVWHVSTPKAITPVGLCRALVDRQSQNVA